MRLHREVTGETVVLSAADQLGAGGEARILAVRSHPTLAAKIYHSPDKTHSSKLNAMLANPPDDPMADQQHISIAWPVDTLVTAGGDARFVGYLMPRVIAMRPIFQYYNPASRRQYAPHFTYRYLLRAARNLAAAIRALHCRGYVVGDLNESNILVTPTALVTLVDTDSFQVPAGSSGETFRCTVGKPEYTPAEIQALSFANIDRSPEQDLFGLGVLIFQLLMEGTHPFAGEFQGSGDPPQYADRISLGHFPYGTRSSPYRPSRIAPPITLLEPTVRSLVLRCFGEGHQNPGARPDAQTWMTALHDAEQELQTCSRNVRHCYGSHLSGCPWCERTLLLGGVDPFSGVAGTGAARRMVAANATASAPVGPSQPLPGLPASAGSKGLFGIQIPTNPWSWTAVGTSIIAAAAYQSGAPAVAIASVLAAVTSALMAVVARFKHAGAWLAMCCLPANMMTAMDSGIDLKALHFPGSTRVITVVSSVHAIAFTPDGKSIVTATDRAEDQRLIGGEVQKWDLQTGRLEQTIAQDSGSFAGIAYMPDGRSLIVSTFAPMEAGHVSMIDTNFQDVKSMLGTVPAGQPVQALSPDGHTVAVGSLGGTVELIDTITRDRINRISVKGEVLALAYSPDGKHIAIGSGSPPGSILSGTVTVVSANTANAVWSEKARSSAVLALAYSPDGRVILSGGNDSFITVRDAVSGKEVERLDAQSLRTSALAFSPDGSMLAAGREPGATPGADYPVEVWDVRTWRPIRQLAGHRSRVTCVVFSPNASIIAAGGADATVRIWRLTRDTARGN